MDFEFLVEGALDVSLHLVGFGELAVHIDSLEVLHNADLLAIIHFLVVFEELGDDLLISTWLCRITEASDSFLMLWYLLMSSCLCLRLQNLLQNLDLLLLKILAIVFLLCGVKLDS